MSAPPALLAGDDGRLLVDTPSPPNQRARSDFGELEVYVDFEPRTVFGWAADRNRREPSPIVILGPSEGP